MSYDPGKRAYDYFDPSAVTLGFGGTFGTSSPLEDLIDLSDAGPQFRSPVTSVEVSLGPEDGFTTETITGETLGQVYLEVSDRWICVTDKDLPQRMAEVTQVVVELP